MACSAVYANRAGATKELLRKQGSCTAGLLAGQPKDRSLWVRACVQHSHDDVADRQLVLDSIIAAA